ncbi:MAG TPA: 2-C-methyl-D-erythritol 4-phosphate cytidylyltransferase [Desulfobacterales bacterium]|nr:2-C-methyl-D-erythritol 4-phosphate cytidylyltransferase [Desulfobacterales bacterium]
MDNPERGQVAAIIVAGGEGKRMGEPRPKQFIELGGRPLLTMTLLAFEKARAVDTIFVVVPRGYEEYCWEKAIRPYGLKRVTGVVPGGGLRQESVRFGLEAAKGKCKIVVVHDGVRPFVSPDLIDRAVEAARVHRAVITALPAIDTLKAVDPSGMVKATLDREKVWMVQTPQVFYYKDLVQAHQEAVDQGWTGASDDSLLLERLGIPVKVLKGSVRNFKITTQEDLEIARAMLEAFHKYYKSNDPRARKDPK